MHKPSFSICATEGKFEFVNLEMRKDLPLFIFPTTPITQNILPFGFTIKLYVFSACFFISIFHPFFKYF